MYIIIICKNNMNNENVTPNIDEYNYHLLSIDYPDL